jgi:hypothetical protein
MTATKLGKAIPVLVIILALPAWSLAQDTETDDPAAFIQQFETRNGPIPDSIREHYQAFLERLENADLRPAQKRRIHNAWVDNLKRRLRLANDRPTDRPTDVRPSVRPDVRPDARPDVRPDVRPSVRPEIRPPQARRGLGVARTATR